MEYIEFSNLKQYKDKEYSYVNAYIIDDAIFFIEPNFYTQLVYFKEYYKDKYNDLINAILDTAKTNKHVIFTGDFESPVVHKEDYIYREIDDCLAKIKLTFDNNLSTVPFKSFSVIIMTLLSSFNFSLI